MKTRDYIFGFIIGMFAGVFFLLIALILEVQFPYRIPVILAGAPLLMIAGIWLGGILQQVFGTGARFSKYAAAGILSFSLDFGILNILSFLTGVTAGITIGWINIPGFLVALTNAYLWNKFWVFEKHEGNIFSHFPKFLLVMAIGITINSVMLIVVTTHIPAPVWLEDRQWLNIAKGIATIFAIIWNFFGYKFIVFI